VKLSQITTAASQATVDFTSISGSYTDLIVTYQARSNAAASWENLSVKVNNDGTSGNYTSAQYFYTIGASTGAGTAAASASGLFLIEVTGANVTANYPGTGIIHFINYTGTTFYKHTLTRGSYQQPSGATEVTYHSSGTWKSTSAITRLTFSVPTSFLNGSVFTLYGAN
jgi:hypothetical protein